MGNTATPAVTVSQPRSTVFIYMMLDLIRHTQNSDASATNTGENDGLDIFWFMILVFNVVASTRRLQSFSGAKIHQICILRK